MAARTNKLKVLLSVGSATLGEYTLRTEPIEGGYRLTITRGSEVQTLDIMDGPQGEQGPQGESGRDAPQDVVRYAVQSLDADQQAQARENIGAADLESVNGIKDDVKNKADIEDISRLYEESENIVVRVDSLKDDKKIINSKFTRGSWGANGLFYPQYTYRVATAEEVVYDYKPYFTIADGYEVRYVWSLDDGTKKASAWLSESFSLTEGVRYVVTIRKANEDTDALADLSEFANSVYESGYVTRIGSLEDLIDCTGSPVDTSNYDEAYSKITQVGNKLGTQPSEDYKRVRIPVTGNEVFKFVFDTANDKTYYVYFTDKNKIVLNRPDCIGDGTTKTVMVKAPIGARFMYATAYTGSDTIDLHLSIIKYDVRNEKIKDYTKLKNHLEILIFGHSYSADSWQYVPFILEKYGITCEIYLYYRGNGSIDRLVDEWERTDTYGEDAWGMQHVRRMYHIDTRVNTAWETYKTGHSAKMVLEMANDPSKNIGSWDIIVMQTAPTEVYFTKSIGNGDPRKGYEPYVRNAIDLIKQSYSGNYVLAWFCSYTRIAKYDGDASKGYPPVSSDAFDNRVDCLRAAETICHAEPFEMIIPAAAAVFNARTNADLASTELSELGNLWYSDGIHLQDGIPCYITNLTVVQSIFNKFYPMLSVLGETTRLTDAQISLWNCPGQSFHGDVKKNDEYLYDLAQKCAVMACNHPFEINAVYSQTDASEIDFYSDKYAADSLIDTSGIYKEITETLTAGEIEDMTD